MIIQTQVGPIRPQELLFHAPSDELQRTVMARLHFTVVAEQGDGPVGISVLNNGLGGVNLVYHDEVSGLTFLEDGSAWGDDVFPVNPQVGDCYWFKAAYDPQQGQFHGKCWRDGETEPADWQVSYDPGEFEGDFDSNPSDYVYSGVVGNSFANGVLATVDIFSVRLATDPTCEPWYKSRAVLL